jgi:hypothetical protein
MNARMTRIALTLIALIGSPESVSAQTSDAPCPTPKTVLKLSSGDALEAVGGSAGGVCKFKNRRTGRSFERIFGAFLSTDPNFERARPLYPLEVGKRVDYQLSGADDKGVPTNWKNVIAVEKYEKTTTPAGGVFDAFVLLYRQQLFAGGGAWEQRWWYSPQVGYVVNAKWTMIQGTPPRNPPTNWWVVDIEKP